jgi:hypothetical protein
MNSPIPHQDDSVEQRFKVIISKLNGAQVNGKSCSALCPAHDDNKNSLQVKINGDKISVKCFAGCDFREVLKAIGCTIEFLYPPDRRKSQQNTPRQKQRIVAVYKYIDLSGKVRHETVRYEPKKFRQRVPLPDGQYSWTLKGVETIPYRLFELVEAAKQGRLVLIVEGEKDADQVAELGFTGTTFAMGAGKWRDNYGQYFKGVDVVLIPDSDEPGRKGMGFVASKLSGKAKRIRILDLKKHFSDLKEKGDLSDCINQHGLTAQQLQKLIQIAPDWQGATIEIENPTPDPIPLPPALKPVSAFKLDMLPDAFRPYIEDVATRFQVPKDYPAIALLTIFSAVCGSRVGIMPKAKDTYCEYPNNYGVLIGRPSVRKSPVVSECLRFVKALDADFDEYNRQERMRHSQLEAERESKLKAKRQQAEKNEKGGTYDPLIYSDIGELSEPHELLQKRLILMDGSTEALIEVARQNPEGFLFYQDELRSLFAITEKKGNENMRGLILTAWNGNQSYIVDRIGRGLNMKITRVNFSILGTVQPGVMADMLKSAIKGGAADDGLMQRFQLACYPDTASDFQYYDKSPDEQARDRVMNAFQGAMDGKYRQCGAIEHKGGSFFHFNSGAQGLYKDWIVEHERELRNGELDPGLEAHLNKYTKTIPSLALLFHIADQHQGGVCEVCMVKALDWADYLRTHAERIYSLSEKRQLKPTERLLREIAAGKLPDLFSERDIYLKGWSGLKDTKDVEDVCQVLVDHQYIFPEIQIPNSRGGRPSKKYSANPKLTIKTIKTHSD